MHIQNNWGQVFNVNTPEEREIAVRDAGPYCSVHVPVFDDAGNFLPLEFYKGEIVPARPEVEEDSQFCNCD